jgi:ribosomal protein L44E
MKNIPHRNAGCHDLSGSRRMRRKLAGLTDLPQALSSGRRLNKKMVLHGLHWFGLVRLVHQVPQGSLRFGRLSGLRRKECGFGGTGFPEKRPRASSSKKANNVLKAKYDIHGFPSLVVLKARTGRRLGVRSVIPKAGQRRSSPNWKNSKSTASGRRRHPQHHFVAAEK